MNRGIKHLWVTGFQDASVECVHTWLTKKPSLVSAPVDCTLKSGSVRRCSPLFVASNHLRDLGKVKALVEAGADLNNSDWGTHWPSEDYAINTYFVQRGIAVKAQLSRLSRRWRNGTGQLLLNAEQRLGSQQCLAI